MWRRPVHSPISEGNCPTMKLLWMLRVVSAVNIPISVGNVPFTLVLYSDLRHTTPRRVRAGSRIMHQWRAAVAMARAPLH
jgi:hypothetical protein